MKKLLYRTLILGLPILVLVVGWTLYWEYTDYYSDDKVYATSRYYAEVKQPPDERWFKVFEVEVKRKRPFNATLRLGFYPLKNEAEDTPERQRIATPDNRLPYRINFAEVDMENIDFPKLPAKFSYRNGVWISRFYVYGYEDGTFAVYDKRLDRKAKVASFEPPPPQKNVRWGISPGYFTFYSESKNRGTGTVMMAVYGYDSEEGYKFPVLLRYVFFVGVENVEK